MMLPKPTIKIKRINLYSSTQKFRKAIFIKSYASPVSRTLKIRATGTHPSGSTGNYVLLDGLAIGK